MRKWAVLCLFALVSGVGARAESPSETRCDGGPRQLARCLDSASSVEDKRLKTLYGLILRMLEAGSANPDDPIYSNEREDLGTAEKAWTEFRDAQCAAEVSLSGPLSTSAEVWISGKCALTMTRERISYLERVARTIAPKSRLCAKTPGVCNTR